MTPMIDRNLTTGQVSMTFFLSKVNVEIVEEFISMLKHDPVSVLNFEK